MDLTDVRDGLGRYLLRGRCHEVGEWDLTATTGQFGAVMTMYSVHGGRILEYSPFTCFVRQVFVPLEETDDVATVLKELVGSLEEEEDVVIPDARVCYARSKPFLITIQPKGHDPPSVISATTF